MTKSLLALPYILTIILTLMTSICTGILEIFGGFFVKGHQRSYCDDGIVENTDGDLIA